MADANLIITFDPTKEESAKKEIEERLREIKEKFKILKIKDGLAEISVKNAKKSVSELKKISKKKEKFSNTAHWIPIEKWCDSKIPAMQKLAKELQKGIAEKDRWKLEIGLHRSNLHERDLIIKLTDMIDKPKVDLEKPQKILRAEIIGKKCGMSLLNPDEFLNAMKL